MSHETLRCFLPIFNRMSRGTLQVTALQTFKIPRNNLQIFIFFDAIMQIHVNRVARLIKLIDFDQSITVLLCKSTAANNRLN